MAVTLFSVLKTKFDFFLRSVCYASLQQIKSSVTQEGKRGGLGLVWVWGWLMRFAPQEAVPESAGGLSGLLSMTASRAFPPEGFVFSSENAIIAVSCCGRR